MGESGENRGREKIAILGGGCGGLAAAFELSADGAARDRYEITVYEMGWRLGGKGASGRNESDHYRTEEHGPHVWAGFYRHAFRMMNAVFEELARGDGEPRSELLAKDNTPMAELYRYAFKPLRRFTLAERVRDHWEWWVAKELPSLAQLTEFPEPERTVEQPGEEHRLHQDAEGRPHDLAAPYFAQRLTQDVVRRMTRDPELKQELCDGLARERANGAGGPLGRALADWRLDAVGLADADIPESERAPQPRESVRAGLRAALATEGTFRRIKEKMQTGDGTVGLAELEEIGECVRHVEAFRDAMREDWARFPEPPRGSVAEREARRNRILDELTAGVLLGLFDMWSRGQEFEDLDDRDLRDWLRDYGVDEGIVNGTVVLAVYDYTFAYRFGATGDPARDPNENIGQPALAAGTALKGLLQLLFFYQGAIFWELVGGMGDVVFEPLYAVLRQRGVRFRFFHRVDALELSRDGNHVQRIRIRRQARLAGESEYDPLIPVEIENGRTIGCWPSKPKLEELWPEDRRALEAEAARHGGRYEFLEYPDYVPPGTDDDTRLTLTRGRGQDLGFDKVVLAIPAGALGRVTRNIAEHWPAFGEMVDRLGTVGTVSTQLWMRPDRDQLLADNLELRRAYSSPGAAPLMAGFAHGLNIWGDFTHMVPLEQWDPANRPGLLSYFCGPLPDRRGRETEAEAHVLGSELVRSWRARELPHLWPALRGHDVRRQNIHVVSGYLRANGSPSGRYVQSLPGTTRYRLRAWAPAYQRSVDPDSDPIPPDGPIRNLFLAGDWVRTSLNAGCVEAAVIAGLNAADGVRGVPRDRPLRRLVSIGPILRGGFQVARGLSAGVEAGSEVATGLVKVGTGLASLLARGVANAIEPLSPDRRNDETDTND